MNKSDCINLFIKSVKEILGEDIFMSFEYDPMVDSYKIWHTYRNFEDIKFKKVIGKCIKDILFNNEVFDFYVTYDCEREEKVFNTTKVYNDYGFQSIIWNSTSGCFSPKTIIESVTINPKIKITNGISGNILSQDIENSNLYEGGLAA